MNTNDITSADIVVNLIKVSHVVLCGSHYLYFMVVTMEVNENQLGTGSTNRHNSSSDCNLLILNEDSLFHADSIEGLGKLIDAVSAIKLMRVWVLSLLSDLLHELLSVVCVLSGIQDLLGGLGLCAGWLCGSLLLFLLLFLLVLLLLSLLLFSQLLSSLKLAIQTHFSKMIICGKVALTSWKPFLR
jgi:hypothetical protein